VGIFAICLVWAFGRLLVGSTVSTMNQTSRHAGLKVVDWHKLTGDSAALIAAVVHNVVVSVVVTRRTALFIEVIGVVGANGLRSPSLSAILTLSSQKPKSEACQVYPARR
jgi:hypothetical protein